MTRNPERPTETTALRRFAEWTGPSIWPATEVVVGASTAYLVLAILVRGQDPSGPAVGIVSALLSLPFVLVARGIRDVRWRAIARAIDGDEDEVPVSATLDVPGGAVGDIGGALRRGPSGRATWPRGRRFRSATTSADSPR